MHQIARQLLVLAVVSTVAVSVAPVSSQAPAAATGLILGRVVDAESNAPLPGVVVALAGAARPEPRALTDAEGRFVFRGLASGTYRLATIVGGNGFSPNGFIVTGIGFPIGGYLNGGFGQRRPNGPLQAIDLVDGQMLGDVVIRMWKTAAISGRLLDDAGEPLVAQVIGVVGIDSDGSLINGPTIRTDDRGTYRFGSLAPGTYVVFVPQTHVSMPVSIGEAIVGGPPDPVAANRFTAASAPSPAIGGVRVGNSVLATEQETGRFGSESPISNALAPIRDESGLLAYRTTFFPSAASLAEATRITAAAGEERSGTDVQMIPIRAASVSGRLMDDRGPVPHMGLHLLPGTVADEASILSAATTATDAQGAFIFPVVPAGQYTVVAWRPGGVPTGDRQQPIAAPTRLAERSGAWTMQVISVGDRPVDGLTLTMRAPVNAGGRVQFVGSSPPPTAERLSRGFPVTVPRTRQMFRTTGAPPGGTIDLEAGGTFRVEGLAPPGLFFIGAPNLPPPWTLQSITLGSREITDVAVLLEGDDLADLVITYTDQPASLGGTVQTSGARDPEVSVMLFPANRERWSFVRPGSRTFRIERPSPTGEFDFAAMPPGEYLVAAIPDAQAAGWPTVLFLEKVATSATTVRITAGQATRLALTATDVASGGAANSGGRGFRPGNTNAGRSFRSGDVLLAVHPSVLHPLQTPPRDTPVRITPTGTGRIAGIVIVEGDALARPVRRATVTLTGTGIPTSAQVVTDDEGRFAFDGLPPGRFTLTADKAAWIRAYYGSARSGRPPGMPIAIADGEQLTDLMFPLARGAAIGGRVVDEGGRPVAGAQVQVRRVSIVNGERRLMAARGGLSLATTDDRGAYRVYGLPPDEYVLRAGGGGGFSGASMVHAVTAADIRAAEREIAGVQRGEPGQMAAPEPARFVRVGSFHPGVTEASEARTLVVAAGDEREGIDIVSRLARGVRIEGVAVGPNGQTLQSNVAIGLADVSAGGLFTSLGGYFVREGRFLVPALTPGRWLLFGRAAPEGTPSGGQFPWWGELEVTVGEQDLTNVVMQFLPGGSVAGRLEFQGQQARPDPTKLRVSLTSLPAIPGTGGRVTPVSPKADGTFVFDAVPPGRYRVSVTETSEWSLRSAMSGGRDTLDSPLDVPADRETSLALMMTDQATEISGVLLDQLGRPAPEYAVLVFSADREMWTTSPRRSSGIVKLDSAGRYRVTGLPPGDYLLCVVTDIEPAQLNDRQLLEELAQGSIPISLGEGERKVQDFKIGGLPADTGFGRQIPRAPAG